MISGSKSGYFLIVIIIVVIGCVSAKKTTVPISSQANQINEKNALGFSVYRFKGKAYTRLMQPLLARVELIGDSGYIYGMTTKFATGDYGFSLPAEKANQITALRVTSAQYDTILQTFAPARLRDSIVINDFIMNLIPNEYCIILGYQDHLGGGAISVDTIWYDNRGKPLPKKKKE